MNYSLFAKSSAESVFNVSISILFILVSGNLFVKTISLGLQSRESLFSITSLISSRILSKSEREVSTTRRIAVPFFSSGTA